jgi:glycolate oxidase
LIIDYGVISEEIKQNIGSHKVKTELFHKITYSRDWSPREAKELKIPDMVISPENIEDISKVLKIANKYEVPVYTYSGGTGMGGGSVPVYGGIMIDMNKLDKVIEIDERNYTVTVQAGITIEKLNSILKDYNLWFPHDPESKPVSSVGSAIACDNDGTFSIKYGKAIDFLLNTIIVDGKGDIIRLGHRKALSSSTGYKLHLLLVGSESTLGIIAEATLRVFPKPDTRKVDAAVFKSISDAIKALVEINRSGLNPEAAHVNCNRRLNYYTHSYREKYNKEPDIPEWAKAIMFFSFNGEKEVVDFANNYANKIIKKFHGKSVKEQALIESWWASKHELKFTPFKQKWPDSQREAKFGAADLGIPIGRIEEAYSKFEEITEKYRIKILGMNVYNVRPNGVSPSISFAVWVNDRDEDEVNRFHLYLNEMSKMAIDLEGTMSTYIGDGTRLVKLDDKGKPLNFYEHGESLEYMIKIKNIFDPKSIMNLGKKFNLTKKLLD